MSIFTTLAKYSTARKTILKGLLPPLTTLCMLAAVSVGISFTVWAWMAALAAGAAIMPIFVTTTLAVVGLSFLNFWFSREIHSFMLSAREVREGFKFDDHNELDLIKLVDHLRCEINAYFRSKDSNHQDFPMPRLCTFTDHHFKIITAEGRNPGKSAIFISSGALNSHDTRMDQKQLAALIQFELVKIYSRRGASRITVGMFSDFLNTFANARSGNLFSQALGFIAGPLQFFQLLQRSVVRSYEYEAGAMVVELGRGMKLIDGIDNKICSTLAKKPTYVEMVQDQSRKKRQPYTGRQPIKAFFDWIDNHEYAGDDKTGYRLISFFDICVRELGYFFNEVFSEKPRATRLKDYLRPMLNLDGAGNQEALDRLYVADDATNRHWYDQIPQANRYEIIGPNGNGQGPSSHDQENALIAALRANIVTLQTQVQTLVQDQKQLGILQSYANSLEANQKTMLEEQKAAKTKFERLEEAVAELKKNGHKSPPSSPKKTLGPTRDSNHALQEVQGLKS